MRCNVAFDIPVPLSDFFTMSTKGTSEGSGPNLYDKNKKYTGGRTQEELNDMNFVIINTRKLEVDHVNQLIDALKSEGLYEKIIWK